MKPRRQRTRHHEGDLADDDAKVDQVAGVPEEEGAEDVHAALVHLGSYQGVVFNGFRLSFFNGFRAATAPPASN